MYWTVHRESWETAASSLMADILLFVCPFIIPVLVSLVSAVIMVYQLKKTPPSEDSALRQRRVTVTVLLLTVAFFLFNSTYSVYNAVVFFYYKKMSGYSVSGDYDLYVTYIFRTTLPALNALCHPLILICRSVEMRRSVRRMLGRRGDLRRSLNRRQIGAAKSSTASIYN